ncbi:TetR/AcrR family transcriptional regulator [Caulobacter endophyticus]|uniref:TetR/AcrR family transcriptional regulator n=1 Tax=Caulobacter endophyticus TaxID=2172652 RepID=A0A2T9JUH0_9CAUL|nr:TetR/AcrR family transcriptional regulator [Caulobacter endophyticus]PVM87358.1 TetR/AcrR family transcriptional regulator [Caulobacter endophyticus]
MLIGAGLKRSEHKKAEILAAARDIFLKEGYADAGMEAVARAAGVSTATLYAYFPSKAELFRTVVVDSVRTMAQPVRESAKAGGDARARLTALSRAYAEFFATPATRAMFRMVTAERRRFEGVADHFLGAARESLGGAAIQVVQELKASGELKVDKPSWAAGQLMGMLDHATLVLGLSAGDEVQPDRPVTQIAEDAVETFLARYGPG